MGMKKDSQGAPVVSSIFIFLTKSSETSWHSIRCDKN